MKNEIPNFLCSSCGNCEKNFSKFDEVNKINGFCYRFYEVTPLDQKNLNCWTSKPHTHFEDLGKLGNNQKTRDYHLNKQKAKKLEINFDNQLALF
jgi:hypothetical protein